jgi:preprotein translocase subunit SecG
MQAWTTSNNIKWLDGDKANIAFEAKQADNTQWRLFIWLAAVFFALEVVILVFWDKIAQNRIKPTMNP